MSNSFLDKALDLMFVDEDWTKRENREKAFKKANQYWRESKGDGSKLFYYLIVGTLSLSLKKKILVVFGLTSFLGLTDLLTIVSWFITVGLSMLMIFLIRGIFFTRKKGGFPPLVNNDIALPQVGIHWCNVKENRNLSKQLFDLFNNTPSLLHKFQSVLSNIEDERLSAIRKRPKTDQMEFYCEKLELAINEFKKELITCSRPTQEKFKNIFDDLTGRNIFPIKTKEEICEEIETQKLQSLIDDVYSIVKVHEDLFRGVTYEGTVLGKDQTTKWDKFTISLNQISTEFETDFLKNTLKNWFTLCLRKESLCKVSRGNAVVVINRTPSEWNLELETHEKELKLLSRVFLSFENNYFEVKQFATNYTHGIPTFSQPTEKDKSAKATTTERLNWDKFYTTFFRYENVILPREVKRTEISDIFIMEDDRISANEYKNKQSNIRSLFKLEVLEIHENFNGQIGKVAIELGKEGLSQYPAKFSFKETMLPSSSSHIVIGKDRKGEFYEFDISKHPHVLVVGATGTGKSVCIHNIIRQARHNNWLMYFVDFKSGVEFGIYEKKGFTFIEDREEFRNLICNVVSEMTWRNKQLRKLNVKSLDAYNQKVSDNEVIPRMIIFIDEYASITEENDGIAKESTAFVGSLLSKGRACGIHLVIGTQRPSIDVISGTLRNNVSVRISGKMKNAESSRMAIGSDSAYTKLPDTEEKQGLIIAEGFLENEVILRTPFITDEENDELVSNWTNNPYKSYELHFGNEIIDATESIVPY